MAVFPCSCTVARPLPVTWLSGTAPSAAEYGLAGAGDELELVDVARTTTAARLATSAHLHNGHLSISTGDAIHLYGSTLVSFTEWGSTSGSVPTNIDLNRYPASGNIRYERTMTVPKLAADLIRDDDAVIVVHGIDYNYNHIYDFGALGVSDLDRTLPGEATAPALCGPLRPVPDSKSAAAGNATTYVASLTVPAARAAVSSRAASPGDRPSDVAGEDQLLLLCHIV